MNNKSQMKGQGKFEFNSRKEADIALVNKIKENGDIKAFEQLFKHYSPIIGRYVHYFLLKGKFKEDAEDILITTMDKAYRKIHLFNADSTNHAFSTWLYKIAMNTFLDFCKEKKNKDRFIGQNIEELIEIHEENSSSLSFDAIMEDHQMPIDEKMSKEHVHKMLRNSMYSLNKKDREILELRFFKELSYEEITKETGETLSSVKIKIHRAVKALGEYKKQIAS